MQYYSAVLDFYTIKHDPMYIRCDVSAYRRSWPPLHYVYENIFPYRNKEERETEVNERVPPYIKNVHIEYVQAKIYAFEQNVLSTQISRTNEKKKTKLQTTEHFIPKFICC